MRQGGLSFGKRAADFAAEGAQRAAGLEQGLLQQQMQMKGEMIPGALLAMQEASMAPQDRLINAINAIGMIEENNYYDNDRAREATALYNTMDPDSEEAKYVWGKVNEYFWG
jgi:hypothetical protein